MYFPITNFCDVGVMTLTTFPLIIFLFLLVLYNFYLFLFPCFLFFINFYYLATALFFSLHQHHVSSTTTSISVIFLILHIFIIYFWFSSFSSFFRVVIFHVFILDMIQQSITWLRIQVALLSPSVRRHAVQMLKFKSFITGKYLTFRTWLFVPKVQ